MKTRDTGIRYDNIPYLGDVIIMQCVEKNGSLAGKYYASADKKGSIGETLSLNQEETQRRMLEYARNEAEVRQRAISNEQKDITRFLEESSTSENYLERHKIQTPNVNSERKK